MKNRTRNTLLLVGILAVVICFAVGAIIFGRIYSAGRVYGQQLTSLEAFTAAQTSLQSKSLAPQTREYIKAQFYYFGCQIEPQIIRSIPVVDYGRVDDALLAGAEPFVRHADDPNEYYKEIQRIHSTK